MPPEKPAVDDSRDGLKARLRVSEQLYQTVLENISDIITVLAPDGTILYESPSLTRVAGYDPAELVGLSVYSFIHPDDLPELAGVFETPEPNIILKQFRFRHKNGTWVRIEAVGRAHAADDGTMSLIVTSRDMSEREQRKQAEQALQSSQQLLRSVITSAPVVLYALDRQGVFTLSEGRALEQLGLERGQVVGQSALEIYKDVPHLIAELHRALAGETFNSTAEVGGRSYQTWFSPILGESGEFCGTVGVAVDVTEQKQLEEQLQQSQKLESVGRLAGGIAHDFNNMLMAIMGYADLLTERVPGDADVQEDLSEIKRAAERASLVTHQLLAFSRKQILRPKTLDLNEVVTDVSRMLKRLIGEDITMVTRLGADLDAVSADPGQLVQVIMNLAVNARDAMPNGGVLTIETSHVEIAHEAAERLGLEAGPYARLSVGDTGTGMLPEIQQRIFEPFFTTKPVGKGTGMGLASVYGIVKQSGGHVDVWSEVGRGSTFTVYLPGMDADAKAEIDTAQSSPYPCGRERLLLVEDEDIVRGLISRTLSECGYDVVEAADGVAALELAAGPEPIAVVITDLVMPKMGGRQLAAELAQLRPGIRILFMSGYTETALLPHDVTDVQTHFLQKPFSMRALAMKIREVLDG